MRLERGHETTKKLDHIENYRMNSIYQGGLCFNEENVVFFYCLTSTCRLCSFLTEEREAKTCGLWNKQPQVVSKVKHI